MSTHDGDTDDLRELKWRLSGSRSSRPDADADDLPLPDETHERPNGLPHLERRVHVLEGKVSKIDVIIAGQLEGLRVNYAHVAKTMDKLVSRHEFDFIRLLAGVNSVLLFIIVMVLIFKK